MLYIKVREQNTPKKLVFQTKIKSKKEEKGTNPEAQAIQIQNKQ